MALKSLDGAVAVITGGSSGIGLATAKALRARSAHVVLAARHASGLQQAEEQVRLHAPEAIEQVRAVVTDVTREEEVQTLMQQALEITGRIDLVVTCAGIGGFGPIDQIPSQEVATIMNINFMGTYHCVQAALPTMRQQQEGQFVFLNSVVGKMGAALLSGYCSSKWALRGLASCLRVELYGTGIGITSVYPAWVETAMIHLESDLMGLLNVVALLTADQVAQEIVQAVLTDQPDLTLAPNPDIASALALMKEDPAKAETAMGKAFVRRVEQMRGKPGRV